MTKKSPLIESDIPIIRNLVDKTRGKSLIFYFNPSTFFISLKKNVECSIYKADMSALEKSEVLEKIQPGDVTTFATTTALSMGIDVVNISLIVIWGLTYNVETFFSNVG